MSRKTYLYRGNNSVQRTLTRSYMSLLQFQALAGAALHRGIRKRRDKLKTEKVSNPIKVNPSFEG